MEKRIYDKKTGIHYELQGDYYLPCLTLPEQPKVEIGIWGCGSPVETSAAGRSTDRADRRDSDRRDSGICGTSSSTTKSATPIC